MNNNELMNINDARESATISPRPCKLTFDLLTLKVVSESRVTWANSVPILALLGLSVLELGPMYATDRQTSDRRQTKASLNTSALWGGGIITREGLHTLSRCKSAPLYYVHYLTVSARPSDFVFRR